MSDSRTAPANTHDLDEPTFQRVVLDGGALAVVEFGAPWCGPCRQLEPLLGELATEHVGVVDFFRVDVDQQPALAVRYGVQAVPTLLFLRQGAVVDRMVGARPRAVLAERVNALRAGS